MVRQMTEAGADMALKADGRCICSGASAPFHKSVEAESGKNYLGEVAGTS